MDTIADSFVIYNSTSWLAMVEINWKQCILWIRLKFGLIMVCFNIF